MLHSDSEQIEVLNVRNQIIVISRAVAAAGAEAAATASAVENRKISQNGAVMNSIDCQDGLLGSLRTRLQDSTAAAVATSETMVSKQLLDLSKTARELIRTPLDDTIKFKAGCNECVLKNGPKVVDYK